MGAKKKIVVVIEKSNTGFSAYAADYPVYTTAPTINKLLDSVQEAFSLYLEDEEFNVSQITFEIDLKQFFQYYKVINSKDTCREDRHESHSSFTIYKRS